MKSVAYSPSHITGFFEIVEGNNALTTGSKGAGVCLDAGVTTSVKAEKKSPASIHIKLNGKLEHAQVTRLVAEKMLDITEEDYDVSIEQRVSVPIGAGFGSSGAGALSAALAMNKALGLGLTSEEASQIAHLSEIECRTGLGTVLAEFGGGAVFRTKAGAPGIGSVSHFDVGEKNIVGALSFGRLSTTDLLANESIRSAVKQEGKVMLESFLTEPTIDNFLKLSQQFALRIGRVSNNVRTIIEEGNKKGIVCSVAMFGETVFSLVASDSSHLLRELFNSFSSGNATVVFSHISQGGARLC